MRSIRALAAALMIGVGLLAIPNALRSPVVAIGPLPECRLDDILTVPRDYDSWSVTLVDWLLRVEDSYAPSDLVSVSEAGLAGGGYVRAVAIDDLRAMAAAAAANGTPIGSWSAYRSYSQQEALFNGYVNAYGYENAIEFSHRPGHSEHQLGLTIDFMTAGGGSPMEGDWATTPSGRWMLNHGWEFGWLMSYPLLRPDTLWQETVCFRYEPWHYRYLGRDVAAEVHASGLTIREYLWTNFTMVDPTTGEAIATPRPSVRADAGPSPGVSPTAPSAAASPSPAPATASTDRAVGTGPSQGKWLGVEPPVVVASLLLVLASLLVAVLRSARR